MLPVVITKPEGTIKLALLLVIMTTLRPDVGLPSVTVHKLVAPPVKLAGLQLTEAGVTRADRVMVTLLELLPTVAVTLADPLVETVVVLALKEAVVVPVVTVTDGGTVSVVLVLVRVTLVPPAGAGWVKVTVQGVYELAPRLVSVQASEETCGVATTWKLAVSVVGAPRVTVVEALTALVTDPPVQ
ncbi:MAG TPA: hypothetical protein VME43_33400, partial [Bryobacteraceae bacterium]|nr:hypothetical protein [Bryobacteraceae bacterium]